jgi:hypothetical protein
LINDNLFRLIPKSVDAAEDEPNNHHGCYENRYQSQNGITPDAAEKGLRRLDYILHLLFPVPSN